MLSWVRPFQPDSKYCGNAVCQGGSSRRSRLSFLSRLQELQQSRRIRDSRSHRSLPRKDSTDISLPGSVSTWNFLRQTPEGAENQPQASHYYCRIYHSSHIIFPLFDKPAEAHESNGHESRCTSAIGSPLRHFGMFWLISILSLFPP